MTRELEDLESKIGVHKIDLVLSGYFLSISLSNRSSNYASIMLIVSHVFATC